MEFGFSLLPTADLGLHRELVLDLVGVQDHPYAPSLVDTLALLPFLMAHTSRIRFFPDVVSLPLLHNVGLGSTIDHAAGQGIGKVACVRPKPKSRVPKGWA